jgi:hypothetical protein
LLGLVMRIFRGVIDPAGATIVHLVAIGRVGVGIPPNGNGVGLGGGRGDEAKNGGGREAFRQ